jgi:hypothetical protein
MLYLHIKKGIKHDYLVAPYLFLVVGEVVNIMIKQAMAMG